MATNSCHQSMDYDAEFERIMAGGESEALLDRVLMKLDKLLGGPLLPPPLPPSPPSPPGAGPHGYSQPLLDSPVPECGQATLVVHQEPLHHHSVMQSGLLCGVSSQRQHLPCLWPARDVPGPVVVITSPQASSFPQVMLAPVMNLVPVGTLNGQMVYGIPGVIPTNAPAAAAAPPLTTPNSKKRERVSEQDDDRPYVKKPLNAFMLFRKEQRAKVVAKLNVSESATVNTVLGQMWRSLSADERAKYQQEAHRERLRHAEQHPEWSARDNYGKKRKRVGIRDPNGAEASASKPESTQQAKRQRVTREQTEASGPSTSRPDTATASHTHTGSMEAPHAQNEWVQLDLGDGFETIKMDYPSGSRWAEDTQLAAELFDALLQPTAKEASNTVEAPETADGPCYRCSGWTVPQHLPLNL